MNDNITLPREVVEKALRRAFHLGQNYWYEANRDSGAAHKRADKYRQDFDALCSDVLARAALAAEQPVPTDKDSLTVQSRLDAESFREERDEARALLNGVLQDIEALRRDAEQPKHPGYIIGSHWLETAYSRVCAGEAEDAILEDYELVREPRLRDLRRDAERYWRLLIWLIKNGLLTWERCRIDSPASYGHWWILRKPKVIDGSSLIGYGKTEDAAIDAAMEASTAPASAAADASTAPEAKP